jgi:hypothetical protein
MRKEIIFAVILGGVIGIVVAFGIWRANSSIKVNQKAETQNANEYPESSKIANQAELGIALAKPEDKEVVTDENIEITGITRPGSYVLLTTEDNDLITTPDQNGAFSFNTTVNPTANQIILTSINGNSITSKKLVIVYSSEFSKYQRQETESSNSKNATESSIENKVQQKIKEAQSRATAYIGTITDIAENTLQIKTSDDQILQVSVSKDITTYIKTIGAPKEITFQDIGIGDFIIAMGFKNGNNILEAKRIIVSEPIEDIKLTPVHAIVTDNLPNGINIKDLKSNKTLTVTYNPKIKVYSFKDNELTKSTFNTIDTNFEIILISEEEDEVSLSPRTIFIVNIPSN